MGTPLSNAHPLCSRHTGRISAAVDFWEPSFLPCSPCDSHIVAGWIKARILACCWAKAWVWNGKVSYPFRLPFAPFWLPLPCPYSKTPYLPPPPNWRLESLVLFLVFAIFSMKCRNEPTEINLAELFGLKWVELSWSGIAMELKWVALPWSHFWIMFTFSFNKEVYLWRKMDNL